MKKAVTFLILISLLSLSCMGLSAYAFDNETSLAEMPPDAGQLTDPAIPNINIPDDEVPQGAGGTSGASSANAGEPSYADGDTPVSSDGEVITDDSPIYSEGGLNPAMAPDAREEAINDSREVKGEILITESGDDLDAQKAPAVGAVTENQSQNQNPKTGVGSVTTAISISALALFAIVITSKKRK